VYERERWNYLTKWSGLGTAIISNLTTRPPFNLRLRRGVNMENKHYIFWVCVCGFRYPACNAHAPYCHLWPHRLYDIFPHYLINDTIFEGGKKRVTERKMCVLIFSTTFVRNISHSMKNRARYDQKRILVLMWSTRYSCQILMKL
jgi:hypothetical protein